MRTIFHFTFRAYRSWNADDPRGYAKRGAGVLDPDPKQAARYDARAGQDEMFFTPDVQRLLLETIREICDIEGWTLEAAAFDELHVHLVLSWIGFIPWEKVNQRLKNLISLRMNRTLKTPARRWFVRRNAAPRSVDAKHREYLLTDYFPKHRGLFWTVDD